MGVYRNNFNVLQKVAGLPSINKSERDEYLGRHDTLWTGTFSGTGPIFLNGDLRNYDYIDIEYSNSKWLRVPLNRFRTSVIISSSSSNKITAYAYENGTITFYKMDSSYSSIYISQNDYSILRIKGYKRVTPNVELDTNINVGKEYSYTPILTDCSYGTHGIIRQVVEYRLTSNHTSSIAILHDLNFKNVIELSAVITKPNGEVYILPYIDENGGKIYSQVSKKNFLIYLSNITLEKDTIIRFIIDFTKYY